MNTQRRTIFYITSALILTGFMAPTLAQEVSIPDPGLNERDLHRRASQPLAQKFYRAHSQ